MRTFLLLISYCFALTVCRGQQVDMSLPLNGAVYQRNETGNGTIRVAATLNSAVFNDPSSDAYARCRLWALNVQSGAWNPTSAPTYTVGLDQDGSFISGDITVPAGWYQMLVDVTIQFERRGVTRTRTYQGNPVKVGVGEVFIIAGQSNAQGLPNVGTDINIARPLPSWDGVRVQTNNVDAFSFAQELNAQNFSAIRTKYVTDTKPVSSVQSNEGIAPTGSSLWYWARLGEKLATQLNVPVAFYNVAWGGTYLKAWSQSRDGVSRPLARPGPFDPYPNGTPYLLLKTALQLYGATYGARAILWLQGETDVEAVESSGSWGGRAVSDPNDFRDRLHEVIAQTRTDYGPIPWVIGKTSIRATVVKNSSISLSIASGQELAVATAGNVSALNTPNGSQVFYGPDMNQSVDYRRPPPTDNSFYSTNVPYNGEPVHFLRKNADGSGNDGLEQAAEAWFQSLSPLLSSSSIKPASTFSLGTQARTLSISADGTTISVPSGTQVMWVADDNGAFDVSSPVGYGQSVPANSSGRKRAILRDAKGNYILTQAINFPYTIVDDTETTTPPTPPTGGCYEAEAGTRSSGTDVSSGGNASGGQYVGGFDGASRYVDITVNVTSAGNYPLTFHYASGESGGYIDYAINGGGVSRLNGISTTGGWNQFQVSNAVTVSLNAGNNTIRVQGGFRFTLDKICLTGGTPPPAGCFSLNPSASNGNPGCNQGVTLNANCGNGDCNGVTYAWSGNGLNGGGSSITVTPPASNGSYTYTVSASKSGCTTQTGTVTVTVSGCGGGSFALNPPTLDCGSGNVVLSVVNSNGGTVEYRAIGLRDWETGNVLNVPTHQRNGFTFTFQARQNGIEVSQSLTTNCAGYRLGVALSEPVEDTDMGLVISPNPSSGRVSVRFQLAAGERGNVSVQSLTGAVLQSRVVVGTGAAQTEVLDMEREPSGLYLIRVLGGGNKAQTGRVLLVR